MRTGKLLVGLAALASVFPQIARAKDPDVAVEIVDAVNKVFGVHQGFSAVHAKGVVVEGTFNALPKAHF